MDHNQLKWGDNFMLYNGIDDEKCAQMLKYGPIILLHITEMGPENTS